MLHLAGLKQITVIEQSNAIRNIPAVDAGSHTAKSVTCGCPIKHIHDVFMKMAIKSIEFVKAANAEKMQIMMLNAVTVSLSDSMVADVIFTELASTTAVKYMRNINVLTQADNAQNAKNHACINSTRRCRKAHFNGILNLSNISNLRIRRSFKRIKSTVYVLHKTHKTVLQRLHQLNNTYIAWLSYITILRDKWKHYKIISIYFITVH
ncbi:hypothetical protein T10_5847 [Trichinella papuae]|uniref:Uncharacterized protein n=1 Tax=Trichinella papuae TaxID=268474 RepID=A0A0V1MYK1_9BILA|nr:hypothetical protein T10_5847 [Trichinella papuae]